MVVEESINLTVNTNSFTDEDFLTFLDCVERTSHHEAASPSLLADLHHHHQPVKRAQITREEIYECETLDDDDFLKALEHDASSYSKLDITHSIENLMKYFDEDVNIKSTASSPVSVIEYDNEKKFKNDYSSNNNNKSRSFFDYLQKCEICQYYPESQSPILELMSQEKHNKSASVEKLFEKLLENNSPANKKYKSCECFQNKISSSSDDISIEEKEDWNQQQKQQQQQHTSLPYIKSRNVYLSGKNDYFENFNKTAPNARILPTNTSLNCQVMKLKRKFENSYYDDYSQKAVKKERNYFSQKNNYNNSANSVVKKVAAMFNQFESLEVGCKNEKIKPTPKVRTIFGETTKTITTPIKQNECKIEENKSSTTSIEEIFSKLSIKEKILHFNKFVEEMAQYHRHNRNNNNNNNNNNCNNNKRIMQSKRQPATGEVISEKQEPVKCLAQEFEAKMMAKLPFANNQSYDNSKRTHLSSLNVQLKSSPAAATSHESPEKKKNIIKSESKVEDSGASLVPKRNNQQFAPSIATDILAPPKKIRRTVNNGPLSNFMITNDNLECLFYAWCKRKGHFPSQSPENDATNEITETTTAEEEGSNKNKINDNFDFAKEIIPRSNLLPSGDESDSSQSTGPQPPENELQKSHDQNSSALSEHQLRVQASLQRLNIPDWFRQYNQSTPRTPDGGGLTNSYKPGNFTRKRTSESGRWTGLNSKTTSLSSLGSQRSDRSPLLLSPSAHSHHGGQTGGSSSVVSGGVISGNNVGGGAGAQSVLLGVGDAGGGGGVPYGASGNFSRWSTSYLNSSQTSPSASQRGSFSRGGPINSSFLSVASGTSGVVRSSYRQPYLGWRSQEKLSQPRTPHERLASSLLAAQQQNRLSPTTANVTDEQQQQQQQQQPPVTPEIQSSIKEVTSAIVHYVNDQTNRTNQQRSRSTSPNSRKCWLESSFVGIRPVESPQTPVIENSTFSNTSAIATGTGLSQLSNLQTSYSSYNTNSSINSSIHSNIAATADVLRMNGVVGAPERSMSSASLEDVLASLLGLPPTGAAATASDAYRSTTGDSVSEVVTFRMTTSASPSSNLQVTATDQRFRRRSEGDPPQRTQQKQQQQQQIQQEKQNNNLPNSNNGKQFTTTTTTAKTTTSTTSHQLGVGQQQTPASNESTTTMPRRISIGGESTDSKTTSELQVKCRNTKCDQTATVLDAKKYYKSCHNCSHLYCSRECRRAHWEKHRKACLHSRASNLCRQVLSTCKDDVDTQRHLSLLARKGYIRQGRGVVRVLFRSAEAAEGFIKHGFQCMGEATYVRWPDLMPAEMGLELYSELLKLSTEYKPDSKMLIYVAICVVSEAPGTALAPVKWERQLVSRCAKLKLCKNVLIELERQLQQDKIDFKCQQEAAATATSDDREHNTTTEILILTFNPSTRSTTSQREVILTNILNILNRRGVTLRKHYPEIYQRLQSFADGQTDRFNPVTMHPRDSQTGHGFVCIIMPVQGDNEIVKMPPNGIEEGGNRVITIDVGGELIES